PHSLKTRTKYEERARSAPLRTLEDDSMRTSCEAYRRRSRNRQRVLPRLVPASTHFQADAPIRGHRSERYALGEAHRAHGSLRLPSTTQLGSLACLEISKPLTLGRRRLGRRLLRARGCELRKCGSTRPPCAPLRAGIGVRWVPSHV